MKKNIYLTIISITILLTICFSVSYLYFSKLKPASASSSEIRVDNHFTENIYSEAIPAITIDASHIFEAEDKPLYPKEVFLTIDDGPSENNTLKVLSILKENGVKATFFMIGKNAEALPQIVKAVNDAGMSIGNHTYTHDYKLYGSIDSCLNDFDKFNVIMDKTIGKKSINFIRFPGGSDNQVSNSDIMSQIRSTAVAKGLFYVDWNVSSGDAAPSGLTSQAIISNITGQCSNKNFAVVLMHDAPDKKTTAEALPTVIKYLKDNGFVFRTFDDITPTEKNEMIKLRIVNRGIKK